MLRPPQFKTSCKTEIHPKHDHNCLNIITNQKKMADKDASGNRIQRNKDESVKDWIARLEAAKFEKKLAEYSGWPTHRREGEISTKPGAAAVRESGETSSDDAADSVVMPLRESKTASASGSQGNDTAEDLLSTFKSRKGPADRQSGATRPLVSKNTDKGQEKQSLKQRSSKANPKPSSDEFVGFGHEEAAQSQRAPVAPKASSAQAQNRIQPDPARRASGHDALSTQRKVSGSTTRPNQNSATEETANTVGKAAQNTSTPKNAHGKRPSVSEADANGRSMDFGSLPKIQKKVSVASPQSPSGGGASDDGGIVAGSEERPPKWYKIMSMPNNRNPNDSGVSILLERLKAAIGRGVVDVVRDMLHELPFQKVGKDVLKRNRMLDNERGLPQLFDSKYMQGRTWPYDIKADAKELYLRWCRQDFEVDLLRGLVLRSNAKRDGGDRNNDKIDPNYTSRLDFHAFGANDLSNGQWFPTQLPTVRDGAHGATQGGISGKTGEGAYSCIMTGQSGYPDQDDGDEVLYCGTDSDDGTITERTQMLIDNMNNNNPARFIRKSTLKSQWAPEVGYRYDGLYSVKSVEKLNTKDSPQLARHRFRLERCPGQDPIRGTGAEKRPTQQEIDRYKQDKRFR